MAQSPTHNSKQGIQRLYHYHHIFTQHSYTDHCTHVHAQGSCFLRVPNNAVHGKHVSFNFFTPGVDGFFVVTLLSVIIMNSK